MGEKSVSEFINEIEQTLDIKVKGQFLTLREQDVRMKDDRKFESYLSGTLTLIKQLKELGFPFVMKGFMTIHILQPDCSLETGDWFYQYAITSPGTLSMKFYGLKNQLEPTRTAPKDLERAFTMEYIKQLRASAKSERLFRKCVVASIPDMGNEKIETEKILTATSHETTNTPLRLPMIRQDSSRTLEYIEKLSSKYPVIYDLVNDNIVLSQLELAFNTAPQPGDKKFRLFVLKLGYQDDYIKEHFQSVSDSSPFKALMCDLHGNHPELPTKDVLKALSAVGRSDVLFQMQRFQNPGFTSAQSLDVPERRAHSVRERSASAGNIHSPQNGRCRSLTNVQQRVCEWKENEQDEEIKSDMSVLSEKVERITVLDNKTVSRVAKKPDLSNIEVNKSIDGNVRNVTGASNYTEQQDSGFEPNLSYPMTAEAVGKSSDTVQKNSGAVSKKPLKSNTDSPSKNEGNANNSYPPTKCFVRQGAITCEDPDEQPSTVKEGTGLKPASDIVNPSYPSTKEAIKGPPVNKVTLVTQSSVPKVQNSAYPGTKRAVSQSSFHGVSQSQAEGHKPSPPMLKKIETTKKSNPLQKVEGYKAGNSLLDEQDVAQKSRTPQDKDVEGSFRNEPVKDPDTHYMNQTAIEKEKDKEYFENKQKFPATLAQFENDYSNTSETENIYENEECVGPQYGNVDKNIDNNCPKYGNQMAISDHKVSMKKSRTDPNKEAEFENNGYQSDSDEDYDKIYDYDYVDPNA